MNRLESEVGDIIKKWGVKRVLEIIAFWLSKDNIDGDGTSEQW